MGKDKRVVQLSNDIHGHVLRGKGNLDFPTSARDKLHTFHGWMIMTKSPNLDFCLFGVGLAIFGLEVHDDNGNSYLCNKLLLVKI